VTIFWSQVYPSTKKGLHFFNNNEKSKITHIRKASKMSQNDLGELTSPYLLQHADNPVHWYPWGNEAFEDAQKQNKPILLSIGYAACHWCHVMAHESFEDNETAQMMNERFINVKVDREEYPDVDHLYQKALNVIGQHGGWPLTMFLTPLGQPFWGGTYFPKENMHGRPSFKEVLVTISDVFRNQSDSVFQNVQVITDAISDEIKPKGNGTLNITNLTEILNFIYQNIDSANGGLRGAPKFPQPVLFDFLWRANWLKQDKRIEDLIHLTAEKMCLGGIYDHLAGGFARYSTDDEWLAPHFEKMLYDNALLVSLFTMIWRKHPSPLFKRTIFETIAWAIDEMGIETDKGKVLTSALDADSEGIEGKYYVWDEAEIDQLLGDEADVFKRAYDVTSAGNWEGKNILRRVTDFSTVKEEAQLTSLRRRLYIERQKRIKPQRDDKVLTDWNAMMIKAICEAGLVFDQSQWIDKAKEIYSALLDTVQENGELYHSWCNGRLGAKAYLEDYANLCNAALALYECTGDHSYLKQTEEWVEHLDHTFWDQGEHGYHFSAEHTVEAIKVRPKPINDSATPSGNGIMANVLCDLYHLTGEERYKERFVQLLELFGNADPNEIFAMPGLCSAFIRFEKMENIIIIGEIDGKTSNILKNKAAKYPSPSRKLLLGDGQKHHEQPHILTGKVKQEEKATAYICQFGGCSAPITDQDILEEKLSGLPL